MPRHPGRPSVPGRGNAICDDHLPVAGNAGRAAIRVATNPPHGASGEAWHETYLDGFGRSIVTRSSGPTTDQPIRVARSYAARGQVESETAPYFEGENAYVAVFRYDGLDRPIRRTHADGTAIATAYGLSASSFATVTVTDELGRTATLHSDAYGRKLREVRRLDGIDVATTYVFDLADNLTGIADPLGNAWRYSYDSLGRRTRAEDPDLGAWTYAYDFKGRLVRQVDAKGQATSVAYDAHDRVTERRTVSADGVASVVANRYDEARPGYHNAGFLTGATRSVGGATVAEIAYDQDEAGRLARQGWTVEGITHTQSATYDAGGRVVERVYPDGTSSGTHAYNAAGWLDRLGLAITAMRYDARGQAVGVEHGRGRAPSPPTMRRAAGSSAGRRRWAQRSCSRSPIRAGRRGGSRRSPARALRRAGPTAMTRSTGWSGPTTRMAMRSTRPMPTTAPATWCRTAGSARTRTRRRVQAR